VTASAVIYVKHLDPMRRFYEQLVGLRATSTADGHCVLESDSIEISLVKVPAAVAATIHLEQPPRRRADVPVKLAFQVASIQHARETAASLGGRIDQATSEWTYGGVVHCDGVDPEGNVIQLRSVE